MRKLLNILIKPIGSARCDDRFAQVACYVGSLLVLVLGILKLCRLGLDEAHLFLGLLLVLCLTMLGVIGGTLVGPPEKAE
jgi:hypothetical protein